jgi:hypothetical protein
MPRLRTDAGDTLRASRRVGRATFQRFAAWLLEPGDVSTFRGDSVCGSERDVADVGWDDEPEHSFFARMDGRVEMRSQARCDTQE